MRVKTGPTSRARHKKFLKLAKGFQNAPRRRYKLARQLLERAWVFSFRDRRAKKREFRKLWIVRINARARELGLTYSQLIASLKKQGVLINRKMLQELAVLEPEAFRRLAELADSKRA
jgi:large subunit ribosomal protein L20